MVTQLKNSALKAGRQDVINNLDAMTVDGIFEPGRSQVTIHLNQKWKIIWI